MDIEHRILQVNRLLANLFVLYIKLHRYRWYVKGDQAIPLKAWFKHYSISYNDHIHELVELTLNLDGQPFATMEKFIKEATLKEATADDETNEMLNQLIQDVEHILQTISELLDRRLDNRTSRMFIEVIAPLELTLLKMREECKRFFK